MLERLRSTFSSQVAPRMRSPLERLTSRVSMAAMALVVSASATMAHESVGSRADYMDGYGVTQGGSGGAIVDPRLDTTWITPEGQVMTMIARLKGSSP